MSNGIELGNGIGIGKAGRNNSATVGATFKRNETQRNETSATAQRLTIRDSKTGLVSVSFVCRRLTGAMVSLLSDIANDNGIAMQRLNGSAIVLHGNDTATVLEALSIPVYSRKVTDTQKAIKENGKLLAGANFDNCQQFASIDTHHECATKKYRLINDNGSLTHFVINCVETRATGLSGDFKHPKETRKVLAFSPENRNIFSARPITIGETLRELFELVSFDAVKTSIRNSDELQALIATYDNEFNAAQLERANAGEIVAQYIELKSAHIAWKDNDYVYSSVREIRALQLADTCKKLQALAAHHLALATAHSEKSNAARKAFRLKALSIASKCQLINGKVAKEKAATAQREYRARKVESDAAFVVSEKDRVKIAVNRTRLNAARQTLLDSAMPLIHIVSTAKDAALIATAQTMLASVNPVADKARDLATGENVESMQDAAKACKKLAKETGKAIAALYATAPDTDTKDGKALIDAMAVSDTTRI